MKLNKSMLLCATVILPVAGLVLAAKAPQDKATRVSRGKYLVTIGGCNDCHTPVKMGPKGPEPDLSRLLSGHPANANFPPPPKLAPGPWFATVGSFTAWSGPWGISYSANLTPDPNTGLGIWTEETFLRTVRTGKHFGVARDILPPMPWQNLAAMTDDDLKAVYAYLRTIPPLHNAVPAPVPPGGLANFE
jgi:mono/diheme cytochrome c family protein